ncbi:dicarboxylate/amino acid:cation symporter [Paracrocinitomix mangrovi]|uniref:dicarboxylate/amino acid:cation symporter n=1 Tax=Paracrocinitomix mangrovi TaxID=2862509 RepID=UPI001C8E23F7|nr:dicarboxylate/amino acid:cation symporter [Paracrocinitomix mangrovi]UKN02651.1 dicarboxylate/amino acid:cation symporter [Paracrocinitomix mangrovi]
MSKEKSKGLALHWKILIGMALGIVWAFISIYKGFNEFTNDWIAPFGTIFIRALKFIAIPLVMFSIIVGISSLHDIKKLGRVGAKTLGVYLITTVLAVSIGLIFVNIARPGDAISEEQKIHNRIEYELWVKSLDGAVEFKDDIRLSEDPKYAAIVEKISGEEVVVDENVAKVQSAADANKDAGPLSALVDMVPENIVLSLGNPKLMLQVIVFSIFFGICLLFITTEKSAPVIKVFDGINEVFLKMVDVVMKGAPFFVFALMAAKLSSMANSIDELLDLLASLGQYSLVVIVGLLFLIFMYPLLVSMLVKKIKYAEFWRKISPAQLTAFSTSSSAATLPVTMECVEDGVGVKKEISSFVLPIGATVNMDGTSLYQAVAVIFLAQLHGIDLALGEQLIIVMTATLASIGSAAVPSAGLVMLMMVLISVGLNPAWIAIIIPVDRILDMCRTVVNVTGDASVTTIIAASENELKTES